MDFIDNIIETIQRFTNQSSNIEIAILIGLFYVALVWIGLIIWTMLDAYRRSRSLIFFLISFLLVGLLNIFGVIIYILIRPPQILSDKYLQERELEKIITGAFCTHCDNPITEDFNFCPYCQQQLKENCQNCGKSIDKTWQICVYCGTKEAKKSPKSAKSASKKKS